MMQTQLKAALKKKKDRWNKATNKGGIAENIVLSETKISKKESLYLG